MSGGRGKRLSADLKARILWGPSRVPRQLASTVRGRTDPASSEPLPEADQQPYQQAREGDANERRTEHGTNAAISHSDQAR